MSFIAAGVGVAGLGLSAYQAFHGAHEAHEAQNALVNQKTPIVTPNKSILDYYQEAKNRYETSPYNSLQYQLAQSGINRREGSTVNNLDKLGSGAAIGEIGAVNQIADDASAKAGATAEAQRNQLQGQYGRAAGMEGTDINRQFQINQMLPYTQTRNVYAQQSAGYGQLENAGLYGIQNSVGALAKVNWGSVFGTNTTPSTNTTPGSFPSGSGGSSYTPMNGLS